MLSYARPLIVLASLYRRVQMAWGTMVMLYLLRFINPSNIIMVQWSKLRWTAPSFVVRLFHLGSYWSDCSSKNAIRCNVILGLCRRWLSQRVLLIQGGGGKIRIAIVVTSCCLVFMRGTRIVQRFTVGVFPWIQREYLPGAGAKRV